MKVLIFITTLLIFINPSWGQTEKTDRQLTLNNSHSMTMTQGSRAKQERPEVSHQPAQPDPKCKGALSFARKWICSPAGAGQKSKCFLCE